MARSPRLLGVSIADFPPDLDFSGDLARGSSVSSSGSCRDPAAGRHVTALRRRNVGPVNAA